MLGHRIKILLKKMGMFDRGAVLPLPGRRPGKWSSGGQDGSVPPCQDRFKRSRHARDVHPAAWLLPCLGKARHVAYLFIESSPAFVDKFLRAWPADLGGSRARARLLAPRKTDIRELRLTARPFPPAVVRGGGACDHAEMHVEYPTRRWRRCHNAGWRVLRVVGAAKRALPNGEHIFRCSATLFCLGER